MKKKLPNFDKLLKSYLGFLQGTAKSTLTIASYRRDLEVFKDFLQAHGLNFYQIKPQDFTAYQYYLHKLGLRTNTRRRKLITAKALFRYAFTRKYIVSSPAKFLRTPDRLERLPWIPKPEQVEQILKFIPEKTEIGRRNRLIVELLAEVGMAVSELCGLRWDGFASKRLTIYGKRQRVVHLSDSVCQRLQAWRKEVKGDYIFSGYNRHGASSLKITSRGIEILFRYLAKKLQFNKLHPKTMRHFVILEALKKNIPEKEITHKLGVRENYPFLQYKKIIQNV